MFVSVLFQQQCFPVLSPIVIDVVLLGFFRHFRHVFVYSIHNHHPGTSSIAKKGVDHDLDSVTALMVADCHLQSWTDLRVPTDPSFYFGWCVVSRCFTLSTWASQFVQFRIVEGREILSLSHGLRDTYIGAQFDQLKMIWKICEFLFIIVQQVSLHFVIGPRRFVRCRHFCWHHHGLWIVLSNKFPCTFWTTRDSAGQFVAHVRYCSVDTELIDGNDCAKNQFGCVVVTTEMYRQFSFSFAFQISSFQSTGSTEYVDVHFHWSWASCPQRHDPIFHSACTSEFRTISSLIQAQEMTNVRARIFLYVLLHL